MSERAATSTQATAAPNPAPSGILQRACACGQHTAGGGECAECRKKREAGTLQRAAVGAEPAGTAPPIVHEVLRSPGQPLDAATRAFMEPRFGHDFSAVRVHIGARAAESARAVNALAYTVGRDIVFDGGQFAPSTNAGQRLLAHELTHAIQQREATPTTNLAVNHPSDRAEHEAEHAASAALAGHTPDLSPGTEPLTIHRQPQRRTVRANRFLPNEKAQLSKLGRGELDELINQIIADGKFHQVRQETIDGVLHIWEVKTEIVELSEEEQLQGAKFGGAIAPEKTISDPDGKTVRHQETFMLRGGRTTTIETALHELIHLRIMIDRRLPIEKRSSFFNEYAELNEMTEVLDSAKFGKNGTTDQKSSYGALPIVAGTWEHEKNVLAKINAIRELFLNQDAKAAAVFDKEPELTPGALIEFLVQEKYVSQTASKAAAKNMKSNETVARLYARAVVDKFQARVSDEARQRIASSAVGKQMLDDATDALRVAIKRFYDVLDQQLREAKEFEQNPPSAPGKMPNSDIFESRPLDIQGQPVPLESAK